MMIETYTENHMKIVKISGEVDLDNYREFGDSLQKSVEGTPYIVVDFSELNYLNSMGLSMIMKMYRKTRKDESVVRLCGMNPHIRKLFAITRLDKILDIDDNMEAARKVLDVHRK